MKTARALLNAANRQVMQAGKTGINAVDLKLSDKGIAQVAIAIKCGTRHQIADNLSHTIAMCKGNTSESHTEYLQIQQLERAGANYSHKVGRDHVVFTLKCGPKLASEMFADVVMPGLFCSNDWQWEITEKEHNMKKQLEHLSAEAKLLDQLHQVSFKSGGLNQSNLPAEYRLGNGAFRKTDAHDATTFYWAIPAITDNRVQASEVQAFKDMTFTHDNITIFTSGFEEMEAQAINDMVAAYTAPGGAREPEPASFVAGESRISDNGAAATGFLGFPGAASGADNQGAFAVLAKALGGQSFSYEGAGLLALPTGSDPKSALAKLSGLSNLDIELAKEVIDSEQAFANDNFDSVVDGLLDGSFHVKVNEVSVPAVKALAASLAKGPKSMVVKGNLNGVDFLADL